MSCVCMDKPNSSRDVESDTYELKPINEPDSEDGDALKGLPRFKSEFLSLIMGQAGSTESHFEERVLYTLAGHDNAILNVEVGPNGKVLASCSADGTINLWNIPTGEHLRTLKGHNQEVLSCSFSGPILASASRDGIVYLWHYHTGKRASRLAVHSGPVLDCVFSKDGRALATCSKDRTVRHFRIKPGAGEFVPGTDTRILQGHVAPVNVVAFSLDNECIFSGSDDGRIKIWSRTNAKCLKTLDSKFGSVKSLRMAPSGDSFVVLAGNCIAVWSMDEYTMKHVLDSQDAKIIHSISFIPDGQYLVGVCSDNSVSVWDPAGHNGKALIKYTDHKDGILTCCFDPYGKHFITGDAQGVTRIWI